MHDLLTNDRIVGIAGHPGQFDHGRRAHTTTTLTVRAPVGPFGIVAHPVVKTPSLWSGSYRHRLLSTTAEAGPLEGQRGVGHRPSDTRTADDGVIGHPGLVEEHLVEQCLAGHLPERPNLNARLVHVNGEIGDALVLGRLRIGSGDEHALLC